MKKITYLILFLFVLNSCQQEKTNPKIKEQNQVKKEQIYQLSETNHNAEGAYLFTNGNDILINWTEWNKDETENILKFAFYDKTKQQFNKPIVITPSKGLQMHAESMAKVGISKQGTLYAVYRRKDTKAKSRFGGYLYYSVSKDGGVSWSSEKKLVIDKQSTSQSFFDIALLPDGELGMIWLDSRKPIDKKHKGKTVYFASTNANFSFANEKPIAGSTCECCRTDLYVDGNNTIHIAYRNLIDNSEPNFDGNGTMEIRDMYYTFSKDNGTTFSKSQPISRDNWHINGCPHTGPSLVNNGKNLTAVWFTGKKNEEGIYYAVKNDNEFKSKTLISKTGHHPQMSSVFGKDFIVYEDYYENQEKGYTKIILSEIGNLFKQKTSEISKVNTQNNHAVLIPVDNNALLIAWVNTDIRNPKIMYRTISL